MRTPTQLFFAIAAIAQACSSSSEESSGEPLRPNVLLVSIDTLRADHLGCYGYNPYFQKVSPSIDAFAEEGAVFLNCFAPRGQTGPSLCSMMTGKYPSTHGVRENGQPYANTHATMADLLKAGGYQTFAFVSACPHHRDGSPFQGIDQVSIGQGSPRAPEYRPEQWEWDAKVTNDVVQFLRKPTKEPFFVWVHLYDVHKPYAPPAPYLQLFQKNYSGRFTPSAKPVDEWWKEIEEALDQHALENVPLDRADHAFVLGLYDGGVRSTDQHVGSILSALKEGGSVDETLVILTADHGEELGDHNNYYFHGNSVYDSTLRIPMIMRWPGKIPAGTSVVDLVQNLDLLPTLLDWLGLRVPKDLDGISIASRLGPKVGHSVARRELAYIEWQDLIYVARSEDWKYIDNPRGVHPKKLPYFDKGPRGFAIRCRELYDLRTDFWEQVNCVESNRAVADRLREALRAFESRASALKTWSTVVDAETEENLRSLGYVESLSGRPDVAFEAEDCGK